MRSRRSWARRLAGACALAALAAPASAAASPHQETILMDDPKVVHSTPETLERTFATLADLGVDRVRVSVLWRLVAPRPESRERPDFGPGGPADPAAYGAERWNRYDAIVRAARRHGLGLLFTVTGPPPLWAAGTPERASIAETYLPDAAELEAFATAVGTRYSGSYVDEDDRLGGPPPGPFAAPPPAAEPLPRVDHWSLWNEPNHPGWLTPQWIGRGRRAFAASPHVYRGLADAIWRGLERSGHGGDVVLLGETAPRGWSKRNVIAAMRPLEFVRELYCLDPRGRPFEGAAAAARNCPPDAAARRLFAAQHPALFAATGWAHHPYGFAGPPSRALASHPDDAALADLPRLGHALDRALRRWGSPRRLPLWVTEYGYQTNPPDPHGISPGAQATYLNEAEQIAYRNHRVAAMAQFLLVDDQPWLHYPAGDRRRWATFQTGLIFADGAPKPSLSAYKLPIHVSPRAARRGEPLRVFGQLRGGARGGRPLAVRLEFVGARGARAAVVARATSSNPRGYVDLRARARASGAFRLVWTDPETGRELASRAARVVVR